MRSPREGWERLGRPGKLDAVYRHTETGWEIRHCGHPTAIRPYYAVHPDHPDILVVAFNCIAFTRLSVALDYVEAAIDGDLVVSDDARAQAAGVLRLTTPSDDGAEDLGGCTTHAVVSVIHRRGGEAA